MPDAITPTAAAMKLAWLAAKEEIPVLPRWADLTPEQMHALDTFCSTFLMMLKPVLFGEK